MLSTQIVPGIKFPLLLDGGLSNQLEKQGCKLDDPLWTALILKTDPKQIVNAHLAYLNAGAKCITTSSYQATVQGFMARGLEVRESEELILCSVELATKARDIYLQENPGSFKPLIAASIGPFGAYLADGSEYTGNYNLSAVELLEFHNARIRLLDHSDADLLACETVPSFTEAKVIAELLDDCQKPAWISFSCKDEKYINDGTPIEQCIEYLKDHPNVFAVGVNCTRPAYITSLIKTIKKHLGDNRIVVYPNSGERYRATSKTWEKVGAACFSALMVQKWLEAGADIVGGCCRVGPDMIREVHEILDCFDH